ncbi:MAG: sirohydrochlorin cobaltochelatase [Thermodesulfobacteriota bacterium]|nr:sirohydrochlorin cobaltochelatase [Thermodesulfobacteriota bacterium]
MKKTGLIGMLVMTLICFAAATAFAQGHGHGQKSEKKVGILLVAFGSSEASAQVSFDKIEKHVKKTYAGIPVRWAFTSHIIRHKLANQGKQLDSPQVALAKMADEKFTHVAVQSLHTIAGSEFHDLRRVVEGFKVMGAFQRITMGDPMLATQKDMEKTIDAILQAIPARRKPNEAVVLMGHGTHHPANAFYAALMFQIQLQDPNVFVGTVEGYPKMGFIKDQLKKKGIDKSYLMPMMSVAGDHAKNDMAGPEEDSWKSILTDAGIDCKVVLKGTAEYDPFVQIWTDHVGVALGHF